VGRTPHETDRIPIASIPTILALTTRGRVALDAYAEALRNLLGALAS
jgi:hypothetical protein